MSINASSNLIKLNQSPPTLGNFHRKSNEIRAPMHTANNHNNNNPKRHQRQKHDKAKPTDKTTRVTLINQTRDKSRGNHPYKRNNRAQNRNRSRNEEAVTKNAGSSTNFQSAVMTRSEFCQGRWPNKIRSPLVENSYLVLGHTQFPRLETLV